MWTSLTHSESLRVNGSNIVSVELGSESQQNLDGNLRNESHGINRRIVRASTVAFTE